MLKQCEKLRLRQRRKTLKDKKLNDIKYESIGICRPNAFLANNNKNRDEYVMPKQTGGVILSRPDVFWWLESYFPALDYFFLKCLTSL